VEVRERRTAGDYAAFMPQLLARHYPQAEAIRLVQDNLHTHTPAIPDCEEKPGKWGWERGGFCALLSCGDAPA
jgi:hypothetical protein